MTKLERETLRNALLWLMESNETRFGLGAEALAANTPRFGVRTVPGEVHRQLLYLSDKGFVVPLDKAISPENRTWRITAAGRDELANHADETD